MPASPSRSGATAARLLLVVMLTGCSVTGTTQPTPSSCAAGQSDLVIVGRIVTMDDPPVAEALLIEEGTVTAIGTRDEMLGDVTILSDDVLDATPDEIRAMEVIATIVGGEVVFCADPDVCG